MHLFDSIERVKSLNDPNTDENEKMSIDQAKAIADLSARIIDSAKVEAQVFHIISKTDNPQALKSSIEESGLFISKSKELKQ